MNSYSEIGIPSHRVSLSPAPGIVNPMVEIISAARARRTALAAQGFARTSPNAVGARQLNLTIDRLGLLQLDSVNVFERSHYLPVFARLGAYDKTHLDRLTFSRKGRYVEYWAHEAALIPVESWPLFRWRMERYRHSERDDLTSWAASHAPMIEWLRRELAEKGPLAASEVEHDANKRSGPWWGWSDVKTGLETLFRWGEVTSAGRTRFERVYALADHVLPREVVSRDIPARQAQKQLVEHAARAHGVATTSDIADYFRLRNVPVAALLNELEEEGIVRPVRVEGWRQSAWLHRDARTPRRIDTVALLSPFDPVVWRRDRAERLFDFHYRIEIYTPEPQRVFGYYCLPILMDDRIVGRIDLKNDRQAGVLRVQSGWHEPHADPGNVAERLAPTLRAVMGWQQLESI
ncbi:MAG TPA: crosslink repair DNA glycosylase YcaQ family protein, partial [Terrimesophilobacter sp.]|nr:crosslink repair DNA glycosylase YcaQ family protein [Terrimesophilobacter sp.]